jgi:glycosyltransferase involved in cell wall biosynthesis
VHWLGRVNDRDLHALYTDARVFCFPSIAEGFGRPPLEALACGTPAVVAPYGPAREVLGNAARIVALDPNAWVDALVRIIDDDAEHARCSAEGMRQAARFGWDAAAAEVFAVCTAAAEPRATHRAAEV